ncbi:MAG TPA: winged helix DNA-binding domain-containing protein [Solirubrobacteraceae bacterium]|nr:winged helix DNA-binding domain-containing protein [Solirubrobacteraceae bacterium]
MHGPARTLALRLRAQLLAGARAPRVDAALERVVGVQAQELSHARLAFRPRCTPRVVASDVDVALRERALVWTWAMRGTLHLVRAADAGWLIGLLGPIFAARGRPRRLALGLDDARCERALDLLRDLLAAEGPQTRAALAARLPIDPVGQAPAHLLAYAALRGVVCRGPPAGREPTYVLLEQWLGAAPATVDEERALAQLARRYLAGHGPATAEDLAAWSGIGLRRARRALEQIGRSQLRGEDGRYTLRGAPATAHRGDRRHVVLLAHFDPYLLGYASRELALDPRFAHRVQAGGGFGRPAILIAGRVAGTWRRTGRDWLEPFEPLTDDDVAAALERERDDVERFLARSS